MSTAKRLVLGFHTALVLSSIFPMLAYSTGVGESTLALGARLSESDDVEEMSQLASELKSRGTEGIPGLLHALLSISERDRWAVEQYGRIDVCITALHELAEAGVYTDDEVPVLIRTLQMQIFMPDTFVTAETLRIITGVDPDYSEEFVDSYSGTKADEEIRNRKIAAWEKWLLEHGKGRPRN